MKRTLLAALTAFALILPITAQTPPPAPPTDKKADPKKPEKAEQEPRPVAQELQKKESQQKDAPAPLPEESHFICSKELGRQLISNLMNGSEMKEGAPGPLFVFSAEKRRVRITVLHDQQQRAS